MLDHLIPTEGPSPTFSGFEDNPWHDVMRLPIGGLIGWRSMLAVLMKDVPIQPAVEQLPGLILQMTAQTRGEILETISHGEIADPSFHCDGWLIHWEAHFSHWIDPVRQMIEPLCQTPDARVAAGQFPRFEGLAFFDFILTAVIAHAGNFGFNQPAAWSDDGATLIGSLVKARSDSSMFVSEHLCHHLYEAFRAQAPFPCAPPPSIIGRLSLLLDIYPGPDASIRKARP